MRSIFALCLLACLGCGGTRSAVTLAEEVGFLRTLDTIDVPASVNPAGGTVEEPAPAAPAPPAPAAVPPAAPKKPELYVVYATTFYCQPCENLKRDIKAGKLDEFEILDGEGPAPYYPYVYWMENGVKKQPLSSGWSSSVLGQIRESLLGVSRVKSEVVLKASPDLWDGVKGSSHENRASLINHLLNEGIHKGRHTQAQLEAMTDEQLDSLHSADHGTRVRMVSRPGTQVYRYQYRTRRRR